MTSQRRTWWNGDSSAAPPSELQEHEKNNGGAKPFSSLTTTTTTYVLTWISRPAHGLHPLTFCTTFLTSQRCTAVSIDTRIAVARFLGQFWRPTSTWVSPGFPEASIGFFPLIGCVMTPLRGWAVWTSLFWTTLSLGENTLHPICCIAKQIVRYNFK